MLVKLETPFPCGIKPPQQTILQLLPFFVNSFSKLSWMRFALRGCRIHMQKLIFVAVEKVKADLNDTMTLGIASRVFSQSNYHPLRTWSLPIWCEGTVGLPQTQHLQVLCRSNPRGASLFLCPKKFHSLGHVKPVIPYVFRSPKRRAISPYTTSIHP